MGAGIDHRLNGDGHARQQLRTAAGSTEIGYAGVFVQIRAYSVADKLPYNRVTTHLDIPLHHRADIPHAVAGTGGFNALVQALAGGVHQRLCLAETLPAAKVAALSPLKPCRAAPTSMLTMSPSLITRLPGMP